MVGPMVGHDRQSMRGGAAANRRKEAFRFRSLVMRKSGYPFVKFFTSHVQRIKIRAQRLSFRYTGEKGLVRIEVGPGSLINPK